MAHNDLIGDVVRAAQEFHSRRLWERFTNSDCIAVRAPGEEHPLMASIMGDGGEQYGLHLLRGPRAAQFLAALASGQWPADESIEEMDLLGFSMELSRDIHPESREFFRRANVHPAADDVVPELIAKPPNRRVRPPNESELLLLKTVVNALTEADRRNMLEPTPPDDEEGVCTVAVGNGPADGEISVTREKLSLAAAAPAPGEPRAGGLDLSGLKPIDAKWLVGSFTLPVEIEQDDRSMQLLLVADDEASFIIQATPYFSDRIDEAVEAVIEAFRGRMPWAPKGLPKSMVFSSRKLHDAMAPALREAGVQCLYLKTIPKLRNLADDFMDIFADGMPPLEDFLQEDARQHVTPAPDDLDG